MTRVLSFLICLTIFSPLFSKWKKVIEGVNFTEYFEIDTVKKQEEIIYIWSMKDFKKLREDGNLSTKFYSVYDCNAMKYKIISIINFFTFPKFIVIHLRCVIIFLKKSKWQK